MEVFIAVKLSQHLKNDIFSMILYYYVRMSSIQTTQQMQKTLARLRSGLGNNIRPHKVDANPKARKTFYLICNR